MPIELCAYTILHTYIFTFKVTAPTEIYTLSLHDALPICPARLGDRRRARGAHLPAAAAAGAGARGDRGDRSEEHTSELQSRGHLVCRLLLEKKKRNKKRQR